MAHYRIDESYYARVKREQGAIESTLKGMESEEDTCPYCGRKNSTIHKPKTEYGLHMVVQTKCPKCGNEILIPVSFRKVSFRIAECRI